MIGFLPQSKFDNNLPSNQIFLALWVAEEGQGIAVGLQCYYQLIKNYTPKFLGSIGINSKAIPFHLWQKFKVGNMDHHVILSPYVKKFQIAKVPIGKSLKIRDLQQGLLLRELMSLNCRH